MTRAPPLPVFVNMAALVGKRAVSRPVAERNRRLNVTPMYERPRIRGLVRMDAASIWAAISAGTFPAPIRLGGQLLWRKADVPNRRHK